jgi:hypothetical protein
MKFKAKTEKQVKVGRYGGNGLKWSAQTVSPFNCNRQDW